MESSADLKLAFFSQKDKFFPWYPMAFEAFKARTSFVPG